MNEIATLAGRLGAALRKAELRLATAESCTGGWIAEAVTAVPGSSAWFDRAVVAYSNEAKQEMLGVAASLIEAHGAVSEPVVEAMVRGIGGAQVDRAAVAVSGIAGPGGGSAAKPVGTVCLAVAIAGDPPSRSDRRPRRRPHTHPVAGGLRGDDRPARGARIEVSAPGRVIFVKAHRCSVWLRWRRPAR